MKKPRLFVCKSIIKRIEYSEGKLRQIDGKYDTINDELIIQGLFVLSVSSFEYMITDCLSYYLEKFPEKLNMNKSKDNDYLKIGGDIILNMPYVKSIIDNIVERKVIRLTYEFIDKLLSEFEKMLEIKIRDNEEEVAILNEIMATRNLVIHNDLKVNDIYIQKTGLKARKTVLGERLPLGNNYAINAVRLILELSVRIKKAIIAKYEHYTYIRAFEELWKFFFKSPVMKFEDYWEVDRKQDKILNIMNCKYEQHLADSEKMSLSLLRILAFHKKGNIEFDYYHYDSNNREKFSYLFELASDYWLWPEYVEFPNKI